jgi:hypothetical protein
MEYNLHQDVWKTLKKKRLCVSRKKLAGGILFSGQQSGTERNFSVC